MGGQAARGRYSSFCNSSESLALSLSLSFLSFSLNFSLPLVGRAGGQEEAAVSYICMSFGQSDSQTVRSIRHLRKRPTGRNEKANKTSSWLPAVSTLEFMATFLHSFLNTDHPRNALSVEIVLSGACLAAGQMLR